jgi:hypothetical protein
VRKPRNPDRFGKNLRKWVKQNGKRAGQPTLFLLFFSPCRTGRLCGADAIVVSQARQQDFAQIVPRTIRIVVPQRRADAFDACKSKKPRPMKGAAS